MFKFVNAKNIGSIIILTGLVCEAAAAQTSTDENSLSFENRLIERNYSAHFLRLEIPEGYVQEFRRLFDSIASEALYVENLKLALNHDPQARSTSVDAGPRALLAVGGIGLSVDTGIGGNVTPMHWRPEVRLGVGFGEGPLAAMIGGGMTQSKAFPFAIIPIDLSAARVSPNPLNSRPRAPYPGANRTEEDVRPVTDRSYTRGFYADRIFERAPSRKINKGSVGIQLGVGSFDELGRLDLRVSTPFHIPRLNSFRIKAAEANLDLAIRALNRGDVGRAWSFLQRTWDWTSSLDDQDSISAIAVNQIKSLPLSHPAASIRNILDERPVAPLPRLRACVSFVTSIITGKI